MSKMAQHLAQKLTRRCRVVICGVGGRMGEIRTDLVYGNPRFELCGVCDLDEKASERIAERYSTKAFGDLSTILREFGTKGTGSEPPTALDGVVISTPTPTHGNLIEIAARNGLGIFVEKPVAESPKEIEELYRICDEHNVPLCCGFQRRYDESYARAARSVQQGAIGKVSNANIFFGDSPGPSFEFLLEGGNIFFDLSVHDVDFIQWALNDEIESVYARATSSREELARANIQDNATMMMTTTNGTVITLTMSRRAAYGYDQRCEIFGDEGKVTVGNEFETSTIVSKNDGEHWSRLKNSFDTRYRDAFSNEIDAFADTVIWKIPWGVKKEDVIRVQEVAAAAKRSLETDQIVYIK